MKCPSCENKMRLEKGLTTDYFVCINERCGYECHQISQIKKDN